MDLRNYLKKRIYLFFLVPPLMVLTVFLLIPLAILLQYSFSTHIPGQGLKMVFTLDNYLRFVTDQYYLNGLLITLGTGLLVVIISLLFAYPVAYLYAKARFRYRGLLLIMLLSPFYTNIIVKIYGWMVILGRQGIVNKMLIQYSLLERPFEFLYSYIGVIVIMVYVHVPMMTLLLIGPIQNIKDSWIESARICGSRNFDVIKNIILPLSVPGILSGAIIVYTAVIAAFIIPLLVGGDWGKRFISVMMYTHINVTQNWAFASAIAVILIITSLSIIITFSRLVKSMKAGVLISEKFNR
ncbi:MAG: ABC transporter permease [Thermodesulfobacteriota bacterium]